MLSLSRPECLKALGLAVCLGLSACGGDDEGTSGAEAGAGGTVSGGTGRGSGGSGIQTGGAGPGSGGAGTQTGGTGPESGGAGTGGTAVDPNAGEDCTLVWSSGFENGFPGEWLDYDNGSYSADGTMPAGLVAAWTIVDRSSGEPVYSGEYSYRGWIEGAASESHRAYPVLHTDIETPLVNTFMVYLDVDYDVLADEWIHFGTWGNEEDGTGVWALHTMSVRFRELEFAHTDPFSGEYIGPEPAPEFPLRQWVRFTVYIHYEGSDGFVQVWQDGVPMLRANVSQLADYPGTRLTRAHWGMYAGSTASQGVQYNDDIQLWQLAAPLTDFETEPDCFLAR